MSPYSCILRFLSLSILSLNLSGCVIVYKSSKVQGQVNHLSGQLEANAGFVQEAYEARLNMLKKFYATGANRKAEPYPELEKRLLEVKRSKKQLDEIKARYYGYANPLNEALKRKKEITSDQPEAKLIKDFRANTEDLVKEYLERAEELKEKVTAFDDYAKESKIYWIDTNQIRHQVETGMNRLAEQVAQVRGEIETIRGQVAKQEADKRTHNEGVFQTLTEDLNSLERQSAQVRELEGRFRKEVGDQGRMAVAPHMVSHTIVVELEKMSIEMKKVANHFEETAKTLK